MKAIEIASFGDPEVMQLVEKELPQLSFGQVLIEVKAIGVNPVDTYIRAGTYPMLPELPYTPGSNIAGDIEAIGPGVEGFSPGDRVYSSSTQSGAYAEKAVCNTSEIFTLSEKLSYKQGASLGVPAATAWRALFIRGRAKAREKVLIHGASGSVGQAAIQLAKGHGLEVFGTAGSEQGAEVVQNLGGTPFRHDQVGYEQQLLKSSSGEGFDLILEMLANKNLETDLQLLANGGRVIIIGSRGRIEIDPRATMGKETEIRGLALFNATAEELRTTHRGVADSIEKGFLQPAVSRELPLAEAAEAHERVMSDGNCGKIVLLPGGLD